ncbi:ABC transporter substrate-binding protein [Tamlana sp. I1]|uniref:type IX secretion system anionic LPS delivery protein PorZ n=1 Tax=Tamlana sp. I1 TaxID=2762061 RepID=UPI00188FFBDD|nr:ABC transporter substrate-binding protein [Tamlana sp. I1]
MLKKVALLIICLFPLLQFSQDYSALWKGHFSYNHIIDVTQGSNKIFAASGNAVFYTDTESNQLQEITTVNGLSGETISAIHYSEAYELLIIGYDNGLLDIVFDNDSKILTVVDIFDKLTIPPTEKSINHFNEYQNVLYISTDFGISVFDMERLEFGDTYFIGTGGTQIPVSQTAVFEGFIYASCLANNGLKKADVSSPNLIDFQNWQSISTGNWFGVEALGDKLYATNANKKMYQVVNNSINEVATYADVPLDLRTVQEHLILTTQHQVFVYDLNFNNIAQVGQDSVFSTRYTSATIDDENIYIGSENFGILKTAFTNLVAFEEVHPDGPLMNIPFSVEATPNGAWVVYGEYNLFYNPYPLNNRGFSHLKNDTWLNTPYSDVLGAKCLNAVAINPFNNNQVYISSFFIGLLEVVDEVPAILYNETNSGLESLKLPTNPDYVDIRVGVSQFDENGLLWSMSTLIDKPLKSYNPSNNQWQSYDFTDVIGDGFSGGNLGYGDLEIDSDGTKWIASYKFGLIGFKENGGRQLLKSVYDEEHNMPSSYATALALDQRNQLWIGTIRGLRVLYNTSDFFTDANASVDEIIIEEDGVAKELLFQQDITDIEVDGANNKWVATSGAGLFYFSPDGQTTIFHFTKANSPLPSNSVRDVSIDGNNGIVYIATDKGLVSFSSGSSSPIETLEKAFAYPNPVRPGYNILDKKIKIKDISENVNIKITDVEGNLVAEAQSKTNPRYRGYNLEIDGGTAYWNGKNLANNIVASGVYLVMLSDLDSFETKVIKLMVVR